MYRYRRSARIYAGFAVYGAFWGTWGAALPAVRDQAALGDGEMGTALLFVGAGALAAMPVAGRAVDRWGTRVAAALLVLLAAAGVALALTARGFVSLSVGLAVVGAVSGGADVAINASASAAEHATRRPIITRAHGAFSTAVVVASLATGLLRDADAGLVVPFALVAVAAVVTAAATRTGGPEVRRAARAPGRRLGMPVSALLIAGALAALAYAVENAHQSWSAIYLTDVLAADPGVAAAGPAVFAAVAAVSRFGAGALRAPRTTVIVTGAAVAAAGCAVMAAAAAVPVALGGLALAAAGTAVLFPMLIAEVTAGVADRARGAATSVVTAVAYLGFLAGPAYVGAWSSATSLPGAMLAVGGLAAGLAVAAGPGLAVARRRAR